ncbi:YdeI/OmpD-associated family protein [Nonomuraea sp. 3-1Str]|uniref:YdeI/OmpD-associated family protein n=1 Tax=Nonomuraea sp. 3-1Str TaxID=2929801 RepID=UPI0028564FFB|nr:YdeI/OmpD-associated family protein [Nonomuraea sp. 3-1Str]MDR8412962.1 YdeI/OmpD-associated family protein [Nonomuraea sp. 3-1Str]
MPRGPVAATGTDTSVMAFGSADEWEAWLAEQHGSAADVWLRIAKKGSGTVSVTRGEALDVALCYGWIDSHTRSCDEASYLQRFSPRRPRSVWSKVNVAKVEQLLAEGRMRPAGLAAVLAAQADGRWDAAYESPRNVTVPEDLTVALEGDERARAFFDTLGKTDRYTVILRLMTARTPQTRAARLRRMVATLAAGEKVR